MRVFGYHGLFLALAWDFLLVAELIGQSPLDFSSSGLGIAGALGLVFAIGSLLAALLFLAIQNEQGTLDRAVDQGYDSAGRMEKIVGYLPIALAGMSLSAVLMSLLTGAAWR